MRDQRSEFVQNDRVQDVSFAALLREIIFECIKAVLPAVCPDLTYESLNGVKDGQAAQGAFLEAMAEETTSQRRQEIESQLLEYCKLDTFAMVRLWEFFRGKATK